LLRELYEDKTIEGLNRYENVQELLNAIKEYVDNPENEDKSPWVLSFRKLPC
jgi:DNA helicase II / ATP-dependent DNA helicase PcrA